MVNILFAFESFLEKMSNFQYICRSCLKADQSLLPVSSIILDDHLRIDDCFKLHLNMNVSSSDELPPNICLECLERLLEVRKFHLQCIDSEKILQDKIVKDEGADTLILDDNKSDIIVLDSISRFDPSIEDDPVAGCKEEIEFTFVDVPEIAKCEDLNLDCPDIESGSSNECMRINYEQSAFDDEEPKESATDQDNSWISPDENKSEGLSDIASNIFASQLTSQRSKRAIYCLQCHQIFDTKNSLRTHFTAVHGTDNANGLCLLCRRNFPSRCKLMEHLPTHKFNTKNTRNHRCPYCGRAFHAKDTYRTHLRTHTGERPFACTECGRSFAQRNALKTHATLHNGKTIPCPICDKKFSRKSQLILHFREHNDEKPYECDKCPKKFRQKCHLRNHLQSHSGTKAATCDVCGKTFTQTSTLRNHMYTHSKRPYACPKCPAEFIRKYIFQKHLVSSHNIHDDPNTYKRKDADEKYDISAKFYKAKA